MKHLKKYIVVFILIIISFSACGIGKILTKETTRDTERNAVEMTSHLSKDESAFAERVVMFSDSSRHLYQVMIYPRDSFTYSVHDGFRGQAQMIEIFGSADRLLKNISYGTEFVISKSDRSKTSSARSKSVNRTVSKELKKSSPTALLLLAGTIAIVIGCCWWKFRSGANAPWY